jgi:type IV pilus assembly protein PilC
MAIFNYVATDGDGNTKKGQIEGPSEEQVIAALRAQNLFPNEIKLANQKKAAKKKKSVKPRNFKSDELTLFTRQLSILLDAGLPLIRALKTLGAQSADPGLGSLIEKLAGSIEGGTSFSEALAQHPKSFSDLFVNMIRAGEASGAMGLILERLATFMEKSEKIKNKVKSAMMYPIIVLVIATIITSGLMVFIVPKFQDIFDDLLKGKPLPPITQFVMGVSDAMSDPKKGGLAFFCFVLAVIAYKFAAKTDNGAFYIDKFKYTAPLLGPIIAKSTISRFSRTLGTLMSSGVAVLNALTIVKETAGNHLVSRAVGQVHDAVKEGEGIAGPLRQTAIFPEMVISMVEVGEETGKLAEMMDKIAETYDEEVDNAVDGLTSMIEPIMIVFLAVVVGTIVIALFLPLISIMDSLSS